MLDDQSKDLIEDDSLPCSCGKGHILFTPKYYDEVPASARDLGAMVPEVDAWWPQCNACGEARNLKVKRSQLIAAGYTEKELDDINLDVVAGYEIELIED